MRMGGGGGGWKPMFRYTTQRRAAINVSGLFTARQAAATNGAINDGRIKFRERHWRYQSGQATRNNR